MAAPPNKKPVQKTGDRGPLAAVVSPFTRAGSYYEAAVSVSASIGHLVSANERGRTYQMRLRTADEPRFETTGLPPGLAIDRETGLIAGYLPWDSAGEYEITVTVSDEEKGTADKRRLVLRVAGD